MHSSTEHIDVIKQNNKLGAKVNTWLKREILDNTGKDPQAGKIIATQMDNGFKKMALAKSATNAKGKRSKARGGRAEKVEHVQHGKLRREIFDIIHDINEKNREENKRSTGRYMTATTGND